MWLATTSQPSLLVLGLCSGSGASMSPEMTSHTFLMVGSSRMSVRWKSTRSSHFPQKLFFLYAEVWLAPSLEELFASANKIQTLSPAVGHCRTLCKLHLDKNKVSSLPPQLTTLTHLTELSFCGNTLRNLPNGEFDWPKRKSGRYFQCCFSYLKPKLNAF